MGGKKGFGEKGNIREWEGWERGGNSKITGEVCQGMGERDGFGIFRKVVGRRLD